MDEIEAWQEAERASYGKTTNDKLTRKAEIINKYLSKISKPLSELDQLDLGTITGLVDQIQDVLDQIWRDSQIHPAYPQERMEHFFKIISKAIGARIETEFKQTDIW